MKLSELLFGIISDLGFLPEDEITVLTERSEQARKNALFVCIRGARSDGHTHAEQAYDNGCRYFVAEHPLHLPSDATVFLVPSTRLAIAHLACRFYHHPSHRMSVIAVTGTKGKTTTAQLLAHILNTASIPCGYIGTNGIRFGETERVTQNTTPDACTLQQTLHEMQQAGMKAAVVEVSSQALYQYRADGTRLACAVFTNLSSDHIGTDEHPDFAHYVSCKHRLFTDLSPRIVVYNADDRHAEEILSGTPAQRQISCSAKTFGSDWTVSEIRPLFTEQHLGLSFCLSHAGKTVPAEIAFVGSVNAENAVLAVAVAEECFGISAALSARALKSAVVAGRSEIVPLPNGAHAIIDYAHNGSSLTQLLQTLRMYAPRHLLCVFGAIGGRSQIRRKELARAAAAFCDLSVLTSDNPNFEDPEAILEELAEEYRTLRKPFLRVCDRADAIRRAVRLTQKGDLLVLAGKGHEDYQLVNGKKIPFSERAILEEAFLPEQNSGILQ